MTSVAVASLFFEAGLLREKQFIVELVALVQGGDLELKKQIRETRQTG